MGADALLSVRERELLAEIIQMHREGMADAKASTEVDPTIGDAETLVNLASGYDEDEDTLKRIEQKLGL